MKTALLRPIGLGIFLLVFAAACQKEQDSLNNDNDIIVTSNPHLKSATSNSVVSFGSVATLTFLGVEYSTAGNSIFKYNVASGKSPALGHWELNILPAQPGEGVEQVVVLESTEQYIQGKDGSLKKFDAVLSLKEWVKFDKGYLDNESRIVSFTIKGKWFPGSVVALVKGGNTYISSNLIGPIQCKLPRVSTKGFAKLTSSSVKVNGQVIDNGGAEILTAGICWSTSENPTITDSKSSEILLNGEFSSILTGLNAGTTYFAKAYATNVAGTSYGDQVSFVTEEESIGTFTDRRDGNSYPWIKIGEQIWMTKNLAYLPSVSQARTGSEYSPYYYVYGYEGSDIAAAKLSEKYDEFGVLYNFPAAQTACPPDWQLPTDADWKILETSLGMKDQELDQLWVRGNNELIGSKVKATEDWYLDGNGNNESGFTVIPAGFRSGNDYSRAFVDEGVSSHFWAKSEIMQGVAWLRSLAYSDNGISRSNHRSKSHGHSVRCIKKPGSSNGTFTDSRDGNQYAWVQIGTQTWMAQNLAYLPSVSPSTTESTTSPNYYVHGYEGISITDAKTNQNYDRYGVLYNWPASTSACPSGWHLPSDNEWTVLTNYLGNFVGYKMKSTNLWISDGNGDNESGFNALPSGYRNVDPGGFYDIGISVYYWSSTQSGLLNAWDRNIYYDMTEIRHTYHLRTQGFSVRCIKD